MEFIMRVISEMRYIIWMALCLYVMSIKVNANIMDAYPSNSTQSDIIASSTLCFYYPTSAATQMADNSWQDTISQLLAVKGFPLGAVSFFGYVDILTFSSDPKLNCDYNIVLIEMTAQTYQLDVNELANLLLHEWQCTPMTINLYYYQQTSPDNQWIAMGTDCDISVCTLNQQTVGIGCNTADVATFEMLAENEKLAMINVPDGVNFKINYQTTTCTVRNCYKVGDRLNVAILQVGGAEFFENGDNPTLSQKSARYLRVDWKKWWQVFLIVVDYIRDIVEVMMPSGRNLMSASWYLRG